MPADFDITANYPCPFATFKLAQDITAATTGAVSVTETSGFDLDLLPSNFYAVINAAGSSREVIRCSARDGSALTVTIAARGLDGTTAQIHYTDEGVICAPLGKYLQVLAEASSGIHGVTGSIVGTTDTQTLTNKTLTSPQIGGASGGITVNNGKARASNSSDQTGVVSAVETKVTLNTETYDPGSNFDNATNYRYTAPVTGYYQVYAQITYDSSTVVAAKRYGAMIKRNGTTITESIVQSGVVSTSITATISDVISMTAGQYIELWAYHVAATNQTLVGNSSLTFLSVTPL